MKVSKRNILTKIRSFSGVLEGKSDKFTNQAIKHILSDIDTPVSLGIWLRFLYGEHRQIAEFELRPDQYNDWELFGRDLAAVSLLSKYPFLKTGIDTRSTAQQKFLEAELSCRQSNYRLRHQSIRSKNLWIEPLLSVAARKIDWLLGNFDIDEWLDSSGFGPGATARIRSRDATYSKKFTEKCELTQRLSNVLTDELFSSAFPSWAKSCEGRTVQDVNVISFVPKNAKTDRTIAIEPSGNMFLQKGIGSMIRRRLKHVGVDLDDQTTNQEFARLGSLSGDWVTVDFRMASDTVCRAIVEELIPNEWFRFLDITRCQQGINADDIVSYEKFSSMGNGFTFELESLIFWALGFAVSPDHRVVVYGDDVVIHKTHFPKFVQLCAYCGFTVNTSKTFSDGYYRESCGEHYWNGRPVTPLYLKERLDHVSKIYKLANSLNRWSGHFSARPLDSGAWRFLFHAVPESIRLSVPAGFGDVGFVTPFDWAVNRPNSWVTRRRGSFEGYSFYALRQTSVKIEVDLPGLIPSRLRYPSKQAALNNAEMPRGRTTFRIIRIVTPIWYDTFEEAERDQCRLRRAEALFDDIVSRPMMTLGKTSN